ncbi:MAG TPA: heavy metal translocating P-type ATPase, partial [Phycisphaerae bacterium]
MSHPLQNASTATTPQHIDLPITGMSCAACAARIQKVLTRAPGVKKASVNFATARATLDFDPAAIQLPALIQQVRDAGYDAIAPAADPAIAARDASDAHEIEHRSLLRRFILAAAFSFPLLLIAMSHGTIPFFNAPWINWLQLALATPVIILCGGPFYHSAWKALRHGSADMNTLIAVGTGAAFGYSLLATLLPHLFISTSPTMSMPTPMDHPPVPVYFESAAVIITLVLMGRLLESRARLHTSDAIRSLLSLQPKTARISRDGFEREIQAHEVAIGDIVIIRPGERIPVDGTLQNGSSSLDESMLTGESAPVDKHPGDTLFAGTINTLGAFTFRATKVGHETALQRIVALVEDAQGNKAPIARIADVISGIFTPVVIAVALLTAILWLSLAAADVRLNMALTAFVSVLIIACPCA